MTGLLVIAILEVESVRFCVSIRSNRWEHSFIIAWLRKLCVLQEIS